VTKRQFKKILSSSYNCPFSKAKGRLKDIFSSYQKDNIKKIKSLVREQYAALPLDGRDVITFLVNKNSTG